MTQERILVVEDEPTVAEVVDRYLRRDGYNVCVAHDGLDGMEAYDRFQPDLVVLDLMLPGLDGMEVCRRIRSLATTPIIMLTARGDEVDKLVGLEVGADDYVTKPFSPRELAARVKVVLRRTASIPQDGDTLRFDHLRISGRTRTVEDERGAISLTARANSISCSSWPGMRGRCSAATSYSTTCGTSNSLGTPALSLSTCAGCAPRSRSIPHGQGT